MAVKVAINGLGRIGRCIARAIIENNYNDIELVAVNGPAPIESHVHLLRYDSIHGTCKDIKQVGEDKIDFGGNIVPLFRERDPSKLPWGELDVDVVLECTGCFKKKDDIELHIKAGAKKVLVSAPAEGAEVTIVDGVNNDAYDGSQNLLSIGSCTTNCLAPVAKILNDSIGIEKGFMTTIHAYTNDQNLTDSKHKDFCRSRAAAQSMIPTSTGAAKAIGLVIPDLKGKLDGVAVRVPTPNVSLVDFTFESKKDTSIDEINKLMAGAANGDLKGILEYNDEPLVSIDFNHNSASSVFDAGGTKVIDGRFCRVMAWYDNEWGFSNRMLDIALKIG